MTRSEFGKSLRAHDWYYGYSDDHRVWSRGHANNERLRAQHASLECPFTMSTLCKWAYDMILERFAEEEPGCWYKQPRLYKSVAPSKREDLITQAEHDEITQWLALGSTAEEIAAFV